MSNAGGVDCERELRVTVLFDELCIAGDCALSWLELNAIISGASSSVGATPPSSRRETLWENAVSPQVDDFLLEALDISMHRLQSERSAMQAENSCCFAENAAAVTFLLHHYSVLSQSVKATILQYTIILGRSTPSEVLGLHSGALLLALGKLAVSLREGHSGDVVRAAMRNFIRNVGSSIFDRELFETNRSVWSWLCDCIESKDSLMRAIVVSLIDKVARDCEAGTVHSDCDEFYLNQVRRMRRLLNSSSEGGRYFSSAESTIVLHFLERSQVLEIQAEQGPGPLCSSPLSEVIDRGALCEFCETMIQHHHKEVQEIRIDERRHHNIGHVLESLLVLSSSEGSRMEEECLNTYTHDERSRIAALLKSVSEAVTQTLLMTN